MDNFSLADYNAKNELKATLEWLRDVAVGPVMKKLGYTDVVSCVWMAKFAASSDHGPTKREGEWAET